MTRSSSMLAVATASHVAPAVAMLRSARRHTAHSAFYLFAVDAETGAVADLRRMLEADAGWIRIFGPQDLGPERAAFLGAFAHYNAIELCCFAKYVAISHMLRDPSSGEVCVFADGDTLFFGDVAGALDAMEERAVLVTPHLMGPSRDDVEHDIMTHGWMNAGFLAFRRDHPGTRAVLDWLIDRISRRGYLAPQYGLSGDQTWLSALPALFPDLTSVSRHPGLNVGCWNVSERPIRRSGPSILAADRPLLLFHFSGFEPTLVNRLSKLWDTRVPPGSPLEEVCQSYRSALDAVAGLSRDVSGLKTIPCSKATLIERIHAGTVRNGVNIIVPTTRPGVFSRLGGKMDSVLRRTMAWQDR